MLPMTGQLVTQGRCFLELPPIIRTAPSSAPVVTPEPLIFHTCQIGPNITRRYRRRNNPSVPIPYTRFPRKSRLAIAIRELVLPPQIHRVPSTDLHVRNTFRVPDAGGSAQSRSWRIALRGPGGVGAELAVEEKQLWGRDAEAGERSQRLGEVV